MTENTQKEKPDLSAFAEYLKKKKMDRTQAEFADLCGVSREMMNRWMKNNAAIRPSKKKLKYMSKVLWETDYMTLLEICGYETPSIGERIKMVEGALFSAVSLAKQHGLFRDMKQAEDFLRSSYEEEGLCYLVPAKGDMESGRSLPYGTEEAAQLTVVWKDRDYRCSTEAQLYYAISRKGKLMVLGSTLDDSAVGNIHLHEDTGSGSSWKQGHTLVTRVSKN